MQSNILIVEDDPGERKLLKLEIDQKKDHDTQIITAESGEEGMFIASKGNIDYCALDLELPLRKGEKITSGVEERCKHGFAILRELLLKNRWIQVRVLSKHTDFPEISKMLEFEFRNDKRILGISNKLGDGEDYTRKVTEETQGIAHIRPHLKRLGIRVVHFLERRLAKRLWKLAAEEWAWPTTRLVIRGEPRGGKDWWAAAVPHFRDVQRPIQNRKDVQTFDCGQIGSATAGDSAKVSLFGASNYQLIEDSEGIFERATCYNPGNHRVDYARSNFAILSELGNLPTEVQMLLLEVLDTNPQKGGRVTRAGSGNVRRQIGCGFIFTTNAPLEENIARSDLASQGELRHDLFERLSVDEWLFVPNFEQMGLIAFKEHLNLAIAEEYGEDFEIARNADDLMGGAFEESPESFSQETISRIKRAFLGSNDRRLTADHFRTAFIMPKRNHGKKPAIAIVNEASSADEDSTAMEENEIAVLRRKIETLFRSTLQPADWSENDFSKAFRKISFLDQEDFETIVADLRRLAGTGARQTLRRELFKKAIGYSGESLTVYIAQIVHRIVLASNGRLTAIPRSRK